MSYIVWAVALKLENSVLQLFIISPLYTNKSVRLNAVLYVYLRELNSYKIQLVKLFLDTGKCIKINFKHYKKFQIKKILYLQVYLLPQNVIFKNSLKKNYIKLTMNFSLNSQQKLYNLFKFDNKTKVFENLVVLDIFDNLVYFLVKLDTAITTVMSNIYFSDFIVSLFMIGAFLYLLTAAVSDKYHNKINSWFKSCFLFILNFFKNEFQEILFIFVI